MSMNQPLPMTIISGYLGAGKTTLVNHLLRHADGRKIIVLVNDFGELPIDADLIESEDGDTINLANGCACCSMGGDLFNALVDVLDKSPRPDHLLIEASGVADPARMANIALAEPDLTLDAIVSLADAETLSDLIKDPLVGETLTHQLAVSDIILLNKIDLVDLSRRKELGTRIKMVSPDAQQIETRNSSVSAELVLGLNIHTVSKPEQPIPDQGHGAAYAKWSRTFLHPVSRKKFEGVLDSLPADDFRLKGIMNFSGDGSPCIVQKTGSRWTIAAMEDNSPSQSGPSRLVAIGVADHMNCRDLDDRFAAIESNFDE